MDLQILSEKRVKEVNETNFFFHVSSDSRFNNTIQFKDPGSYVSKKKSKRNFFFVIFFVICMALVYGLLIQTGYLKIFAIKSYDWLKQEYQEKPWLVYIIVYAIINIQMIFCLDLKMIVFIITGLTLQNSYLTFFLLFGSLVSGDLMVFWISKFWLKNYFISKFNESDIFVVLVDESKKEPFTTAFMIRMLMIPNGIKNYVLMAIENNYLSYFISGAFFHAIFVLEAIILTAQFTEIEEFIYEKKTWSEKTTAEQFLFLLFIMTIIIGVLISVSLGIWAKKKIDAKKIARNNIKLRNLRIT